VTSFGLGLLIGWLSVEIMKKCGPRNSGGKASIKITPGGLNNASEAFNWITCQRPTEV
jgi:hypothetical protein